MKPLNRRSSRLALPAVAMALPAVGLCKSPVDASELRALIEAHSLAYRAFCEAPDREEDELLWR
jgi:hypothetical protein